MKVFLINDTSSYHFGCKMVVKTVRDQLEERGVELVGTAPSKHTFRRYRPVLDMVDLVIVNGEGSLHHGRRRDLFDVALEYPCALINFSISDYDNFPLEAADRFKYIAARESMSAREWTAIHGARSAITVPELSLMQNPTRFVYCDGSEREIGIFDSVDTLKAAGLIRPFGDSFIRESQKYRRWVTGRLHGVCLAIILGIPFSAYATHSHKIKGLMYDAGLGKHFYPNRELALEGLPENADPAAGEYLAYARKRIPQMFDEILSL